ncbi:MAG: O-methyltransferase [Planctomycetota bacterium]|jgi:predicted O-methyltransferase YrrM
MDIVVKETEAYLRGLVPPRPAEIEAMEAEAKEKKFPIIGPACGHLCYQIARMIGARKIFELGSGFGYSTYWFAKAVKENGGGEVHHTVWDEDLSREARTHLEILNLAGFVRFHVREAVEAMEDTDGTFDLIFCDIDKDGYPKAFAASKPKLREGGVMIFDNMLWGGRIFDESENRPSTVGVRDATKAIFEDADFVTTLVPIRDGMTVSWRKS